MTDITLDGLILNPDLIWTDRFKYAGVAQSTDRTLAGTLIVFNQTLTKGRPVTLQADESVGWFTKSMVDQIYTWAQEPGKIMIFDYHGQETHSVMFDHENGPAIDFEFLVNRIPFLTTDYFIGTIKLFTV